MKGIKNGRENNKSSKKHLEKYVALRSFNDQEIVAFDRDPAKAYEKAKKKGVKDPVLMFIPDPNISHIYNVA